LRNATRRLIHRIVARGKLCLFIDGLDEHEGKYSDLIDLCQEFAAVPNLKLCLSSRPLLVFENIFSSMPKLRFQDLTQRDITLYVHDNLQKVPQMVELSSEEPKATEVLVEEIVNKADGVFFWVRFVVKSLLDGLCDGDHTVDLQRRLRNTPPDLESLYQFMLNSVDPNYVVEASQIFQIVRSHFDGTFIFRDSCLNPSFSLLRKL